MPHYLAALFLVALTTQAAPPSTQGQTDNLALCVVFLHGKLPDGSPGRSGSGFLVAKDGDVYLVTAAHVARAVGPEWMLLLQGGDGKAATAPMKDSAWKFSQDHDVAVLHLQPKSDQKTFLLAHSLPVKVLGARPLPPSRDVTLTAMGYPLGIGTEGYVSPLSIETKAATGLIRFPRFDTKEPADFILLQHPSVGGLSGGPIFDTGLSAFGPGRAIVVREGVSLVGLMHGEVVDRGVGKLAAVVPASYIATLLGVASPEK